MTVNGNGGFIGSIIKESYIGNILKINPDISYYSLVLFTIFLFLISIDFKISKIVNSLKFLKNIFKVKRREDTDINNEIINKKISSENKDEKSRIQDSLPFENKIDTNNVRFIIPDIKFLKSPTKNEKSAKKNDDINESYLEKVLMDFGVEGKIKKINYGPVVTLNEFEPAAGVKVSKIINLSEDIARNTSSESARISIIPGSNTIGIELPNLTRENVYLSEVIKDAQFKKEK